LARETASQIRRDMKLGGPLYGGDMAMLSVILAPGSVNHIANIVKGYAIAIGVVFAIWFVWQWWRVRVRETQDERSARAKGIFARYLALALNNPELAEPMLGSLSSPAEAARYKFFVAGLLAAADEILTLEPKEHWTATLSRQLAPHKSYLTSDDFYDTLYNDCSEELRQLVRGLAGN
jgi:hypothetical protein